MKTLIIYDNSGTIFTKIEGSYVKPIGLQHLEVEIPEGKKLIGVDVSVSPHKAILKDAPKSEIEQLKQTVADLTEIVLMGGV